jgi:hypothetical protein
MAREKNIEPRLREGVKKRKGMCIKLWAFSMVGLPDRLILMPGGRVWFVETKSTGDKPKPHQLAMHNRLWLLGFHVWVIDDNVRLNNFFKELDEV